MAKFIFPPPCLGFSCFPFFFFFLFLLAFSQSAEQHEITYICMVIGVGGVTGNSVGKRL